MYIVNVSLLRRKQLEVEQLSSCFYEVVLQTCANIATFSRAKDEIIFAAIWTLKVGCLRKIRRRVLDKGGLLCWVFFYKQWTNETCQKWLQNWIKSKINLVGSFYMFSLSINNVVNIVNGSIYCDCQSNDS